LAFNLDRLTLSLFTTLGWRLNNGVDLQSTLDVKWLEVFSRTSIKTYCKVLGGEDVVKIGRIGDLFGDEGRETSIYNSYKVAFRAWSAALALRWNDLEERLHEIPKIDSVPLVEWVRASRPPFHETLSDFSLLTSSSFHSIRSFTMPCYWRR
jgi:hypothetical protein